MQMIAGYAGDAAKFGSVDLLNMGQLMRSVKEFVWEGSGVLTGPMINHMLDVGSTLVSVNTMAAKEAKTLPSSFTGLVFMTVELRPWTSRGMDRALFASAIDGLVTTASNATVTFVNNTDTGLVISLQVLFLKKKKKKERKNIGDGGGGVAFFFLLISFSSAGRWMPALWPMPVPRQNWPTWLSRARFWPSWRDATPPTTLLSAASPWSLHRSSE